jgi:phosphonate transport system substrate-binding protein
LHTDAGVRAEPTYRLGVVPRLPPAETARDWSPLAERLGRDVGADITLRLYRTLREFEGDLARGQLELAFLNPYQQVIARRQQGYVPLVRDGRSALSGTLVVRADSPLRTLADLHGKVIAFPDPNAFGASLYMRALLAERHGIRFTARYVGNHSNVYRHVLRELAGGGGGVNATLEREPVEVRGTLRVLYETPPVAPHPLSAHPRVASAQRERLAGALERLGHDDDGRGLLARAGLGVPVRADHRRDYAPLEKLRLERYYVATEGAGQ